MGDGSLRPASRVVPGEVTPINFAVVPPGTTMEIFFDQVESEPTTGELTIGYSDLNGREYGTSIQLRRATAYLADGAATALAMTAVAHADKNEIALPYEDPRNYADYRRFPRLFSLMTEPVRAIAARFGRRP